MTSPLSPVFQQQRPDPFQQFGTAVGTPLSPVFQQSYNVAGVRITDEDISDGINRGVTPEGVTFSQFLSFAAEDPGAAALSIGQGIVGGIVEIGKDLAAIPEAASVVVTGPGERTDEELEELRKRALRGSAFLGSIAAFSALGAVAFAARPVLANLARGAISGGLYGLIKPKHEGESLVSAIAKDAALFGGFGLAIDLLPLFKGINPFARALESTTLDPGAARSVQTMMASISQKAGPLDENVLQTIKNLKNPDYAAAAIEQTRTLPVRLSDTPVGTGVYAQMELGVARQRTLSEAIEQAGRLGEAGQHREAAALLREAMEAQKPRVLGGTPEELAAAEAARAQDAFRDLKSLGDDFKLPNGQIAQVEVVGNLYRGRYADDEVIGRSVQEVLDYLGIRSGASQSASILTTEAELGLLRTLEDTFKGGSIRVVRGSKPLGLYGRTLAPAWTWKKVWPKWEAIWNNARGRTLMSKQIRDEWDVLLKSTKRELNGQERIQLGELLNQYALEGAIPESTPPKIAEMFGRWRTRLDIDRAALAKLEGALPDDWGLDAYFMHVNAGDWKVVNSKTGSILVVGQENAIKRTMNEAQEFAQRYLETHPAAQLRIEPKTLLYEGDAAMGVGKGPYITYLSKAQNSLQLESIGRRPVGGEKWFAHSLNREKNLPGWIQDPVEAARIYSFGLSRKVAFHDFAQKTMGLLRKAREDGELHTTFYDAAIDWVNAVVGRPTQTELAFDSVARWLSAGEMPTAAQGVLRRATLKRAAGVIRHGESIWRLGYSPLSAFVNMSQTWVNTASKVGYRDTAIGTKLLAKASRGARGLNKEFANKVDNALTDMGVEFAVPLSGMGDAAFKDMYNLSWWSPLYMFNKVENVNRSIAGLAGYVRKLRQHGKNFGDDIADDLHQAAVLEGRKLSDQMNFVYSVEDLPALLRGPIGSVLGQFKPFLINELHFIAGLRGAEIPRFMFNLTAAGGVGAVMSLPGLNLIDVLGGSIFGERPSELAKRKAPKLARGVLGMLGFDAERSIAINSIMAGREFVSGDRSILGEVFDLSFGPFAQDAVALSTAALFGAQKGLETGLEAVGIDVPHREPLTPAERTRIARTLYQVQYRRLADAWRVASTGTVIDPTSNRPLFEPENVAKEVIFTGMGFRTVERAEVDRERATINRIAQGEARTRRVYVERILNAQADNNWRKANDIRREARLRGVVITGSMVNRARDERRKSVLERSVEQLPRRRRYQVEREIRSTIPGIGRVP